MNERIKELARDCGYQHIPLTSLGKVGDFDYFDIERFAELIVKEILSYTEEGDLDFMKFMIKKNFGVEE